MSKTIVCTVPNFEGPVTFADPLNYPQLIAWRETWNKAQEISARLQEGQPDDAKKWVVLVTDLDVSSAILPGVLTCVESFDNKGMILPVSIGNFPASPRPDAVTYLVWLITQIGNVINGVDTDLKAPEPPSTSG